MVSANGKIREVGEGEGIEEERRHIGKRANFHSEYSHGKAFGKQFRSLEVWNSDIWMWFLLVMCNLYENVISVFLNFCD